MHMKLKWKETHFLPLGEDTEVDYIWAMSIWLYSQTSVLEHLVFKQFDS